MTDKTRAASSLALYKTKPILIFDTRSGDPRLSWFTSTRQVPHCDGDEYFILEEAGLVGQSWLVPKLGDEPANRIELNR